MIVDPIAHAHEIARFATYCVPGPREGSCTIYTGAIGDDGYGRFWVGRAGGPSVVRAQRFAYAAVYGWIDGGVVAMHECDNPICVRAGAGHVVPGTQADNLAHMAHRGRGGGSGYGRGGTGLDRQARRARALALRDAVAAGWDDRAVQAALGVAMPGQLGLFDWDETSPDAREVADESNRVSP
ncbi:hypothetical protein [Gordonia humi]|uniref:HNH endonuclease n=1 Tax=Gordonia humi TaxID=686429 RepID=A0A840F2E5_9ACTN|nr:hypothetical protein [Gordonia humi]